MDFDDLLSFPEVKIAIFSEMSQQLLFCLILYEPVLAKLMTFTSDSAVICANIKMIL